MRVPREQFQRRNVSGCTIHKAYPHRDGSIEKLRGTAAFRRRGDRTGTGRARCPSSSGFQRSERPLDGELASVWRPPPLGGGGSRVPGMFMPLEGASPSANLMEVVSRTDLEG